MKKRMINLGVASILLMGANLSAHVEEYTLNDLTKTLLAYITTYENEEESEQTSFILHVQEGDEIPLQFNLTGEILEFKEKPQGGKIIALQPFFLKLQKGEFFFSLDKENWKPFINAFGGELSAGLGRDDSNELIGNISLKHHLK